MNQNNFSKIFKYFVLITFALLVFSCDGGLSPKPITEKSYLRGVIKYINGSSNWPQKDSVKAVRIAAFKKMPDSGIINDIISGNAYFNFTSFDLFVDSNKFELEITKTPVDLNYIAACLQYDTLVTSQKVIGIYTTTGDKNKPSVLRIESGKSYSITIDVDFNNLPPMPY